MTEQNKDDLTFLQNCLEDALSDDLIRITFKDSAKPTVTITRIENIAGKMPNILVSTTAVNAYDVNLDQWIDINLSEIETAETVTVLRTQ